MAYKPIIHPKRAVVQVELLPETNFSSAVQQPDLSLFEIPQGHRLDIPSVPFDGLHTNHFSSEGPGLHASHDFDLPQHIWPTEGPELHPSGLRVFTSTELDQVSFS